MRSFAESQTRFHLVRSDTPITEDGFKIGELTGEVVCLECDAAHTNIDEIPHAEDCSQRFVHSRFYLNAMRAE